MTEQLDLDTFDLDAITPTHEQKERNRERTNWSNCDEECIVCGKGMRKDRKPQYVHMLTSGQLAERDYDGPGSQGCFPVGSECARKIPARFRFTFED